MSHNKKQETKNKTVRFSTVDIKASAASKSKIINSGTGGYSKIGTSNKSFKSMNVEDYLERYNY
jgi:hypothetical protein